MKKIIINEISYEIIEDYNEGFDETEFKERYTEYFEGYDYILGDWSYGKLRLKGFCNKKNKFFKKINNYNKKDEYLKEKCSYGCKYFVAKKTIEK